MDDRTADEMIALLPRLKRFAFSLTGSLPEADDLVQMTCERAISRIDRWQRGTRLDSWMYRIAQNLHLNNLRNAKVQTRHLQAVAADGDGAVSPASGVDRVALGEVGAMIAALPAEQRAALLLVAVEGWDYSKAAEILDTSPGTIASRVSRARRALVEQAEGGSDVSEAG